MALGVGIFGAEGGAERIHIAKSHGKGLGIKLAGYCQVRGFAEKVLAEVHRTVFSQRRIFGVQRSHAKHFTRALAVAGSDQGRMHIHKATLLEKLMHRHRRHGAHAKHRRKQVCAGAQMGDGAQIFHRVALFLQGILRRGGAFHRNIQCRQFQRLLGLRRQLHRAAHDQRRSHIQLGDFPVIVHRSILKYHLQIFKAAAVVKFDEAKGFHVADGAHPAADGDFLAAQGLAVGIHSGNFGSLHIVKSLLFGIRFVKI